MTRAALILAPMAVACVPLLDVEGAPCDATTCADGYSCCDGVCIAADEPCLGACAAPVSGAGADRYLPFIPGSTWVYEVRVADTDQLDGYKHLRLGGEEDLAPVAEGRAHRLCREDRSIDDIVQRGAIRWEQDRGDAAVWIRSLRFDANGVSKDELSLPHAVRVDESAPHLCVNAAYDSSWVSRVAEDPASCPGGPSSCPSTDTAMAEHWRVDAIDELADVPGLGELPALRVTRWLDLGDVDEVSTFWFVRGVGKVAELVPTDEKERLIYFDVPGIGSGGSNPFRALADCDEAWTPGFP